MGLYTIRRQSSVPITLEQEATNVAISHDCVIVDNYFGRLCTLWAVCSDKYRWQEPNYELNFRACVTLTNIHVRVHPLRVNDEANYASYQRRLYTIG
ncbi:hypothetical protein GN244_ATG06208 [Phytophthora infestans]|uniref:DDE Tnp4 domain-containing protein n=1 Tax=Phytophthora infestans TaxID=4787 RepID=A0A833T851_PHYIN|nr:hypothetical protein GN244_ATG06208 [Phytophthora infestans]